MLAVEDCAHAQLATLAVKLGHARLLDNGILSIEAMMRGYHESTRVFGLLPLAKNLKPWQRTDTETSLAPAAALATACGVGQRSRSLKKFCRIKFS